MLLLLKVCSLLAHNLLLRILGLYFVLFLTKFILHSCFRTYSFNTIILCTVTKSGQIILLLFFSCVFCSVDDNETGGTRRTIQKIIVTKGDEDEGVVAAMTTMMAWILKILQKGRSDHPKITDR